MGRDERLLKAAFRWTAEHLAVYIDKLELLGGCCNERCITKHAHERMQATIFVDGFGAIALGLGLRAWGQPYNSIRLSALPSAIASSNTCRTNATQLAAVYLCSND